MSDEAEKSKLADRDKYMAEVKNFVSGQEQVALKKGSGVGGLPKIKAPKCVRTFDDKTFGIRDAGHMGNKCYAVSWAGDSETLAVAMQCGAVAVLDTVKGKQKKVPVKEKFVMQCAISDNGNIVACGGMNNVINIHKCDGGMKYDHMGLCGEPGKYEPDIYHDGYIAQIHFVQSDTKMLSGSGDGTIILWDVERRKPIQSFQGHGSDVTGVGLSKADENIFASTSTDKTVRMWDVRQPYATRCMQAKYGTNCCAITDNGNLVAAGQDNASFEIFDYGSNTQVGRGKVKRGRCESIAFSKSGRVLYLGWDQNPKDVVDSCLVYCDPFEVNNAGSECCKGKWCKQNSSVMGLAVSPDGTALASASFDHTVMIFSGYEEGA